MYFSINFFNTIFVISAITTLIATITLLFTIFQLRKIARGQKLSTILSIELNNVKVEDLKADKVQILQNMLNSLERGKELYGNKNNLSPDTWAFHILNRSGFSFFVKDKNPAEKALAGLLANGDMEKVKTFLKTLVENL